MRRVIEVEELTRVEGHGRIEVVIEGTEVKDVKMANIRGAEILRSLHRVSSL